MMNTTTAPAEARSMLFLHALTALHPGSGTALGTVDMPVQRERHTQWPVIPGSSLKGVLRDTCRPTDNESNTDWLAVFGPETTDAAAHAGALVVTDARLLAFPVRSARGVFAWTTCPAALGRLSRDLGLVSNGNNTTFPEIQKPGKDEALAMADGPLIIDGKKLLLEEFEFQQTGPADPIAAWIAQHATADRFTQERIKSHLVVLHDDDFTHFVRHATEVLARVGLDYQHKTVKSGALFYEEFLPVETLFYSVLLAHPSRKKDHIQTSESVMNFVSKQLPSVLQIGGNETIGKGFCSVRLDCGKDII